jgi:hypothetical protein
VDIVTLAGLVKIELPAKTLLLCDGAFVKWSADTFFSDDDEFGIIGAIEPLSEGVGDSAPALRLTFLPSSTADAAALSQPGWQGSRVRLWIAEVDLNTNAIIGTPDLMFDGQTDSTELIIGKGKRDLVMDIVSAAERLFVIDEANTLSDRFHQSLYPGERGEENATGIGVGVAWGTALPTQSYGLGFYGGGSGGGGGGRNFSERLV